MRCRVQLHSVSPVCPKLMTSQKVLHSEPSVSDGFDGCFPACFRNCLLRQNYNHPEILRIWNYTHIDLERPCGFLAFGQPTSKWVWFPSRRLPGAKMTGLKSTYVGKAWYGQKAQIEPGKRLTCVCICAWICGIFSSFLMCLFRGSHGMMISWLKVWISDDSAQLKFHFPPPGWGIIRKVIIVRKAYVKWRRIDMAVAG